MDWFFFKILNNNLCLLPTTLSAVWTESLSIPAVTELPWKSARKFILLPMQNLKSLQV